jgi:uncharacterized membrane protein
MSTHDKDGLARLLGGFSLALGTPQVLAPGVVNRAIGVADDAESRSWQRGVGLRELSAAGGIFTQRRPVEWVCARVAGDVMDVALLAAALRRKGVRRDRTLAALAAVAGIATLDALEAVRLSRAGEPREQREGLQPGSRAPAPKVKAAITVQASPDEAYAFWRELENLPGFMAHLESVQSKGDGRSRWTAKGPAGRSITWDAEVVEERPGELIAWRSVEGADVPNAGSVRFRPAPADQGTEILLELDYTPPGGKLGTAVAKLLGEEPQTQVNDDLRRLKQVMETGEVVRSEGTPEGAFARRLVRQRPAQPIGSPS